MTEPTVAVPVSLMRKWSEDLILHLPPGTFAIVGEMRALLSHPTPTAETVACPHWEPGQITMRNGCTACAAEAAPPPIPDMVPGTTFVARPSGSPRWLAFSRLPGADPDVEDNEGDRWRWFAIDPSTIRDVQPPEET